MTKPTDISASSVVNAQALRDYSPAIEFFNNFTTLAEQTEPAIFYENEQIGRGRLFDLVRQHNDLNSEKDIYTLNIFLLRVAYCYYAEDTGLFEKGQFTQAISTHIQPDACDASNFFTRLFYVLSKPNGSKARDVLQSEYTSFSAIDNTLFDAAEPVPELTADIRTILIDCGALDWSGTDPSIFDLMFRVADYNYHRAVLESGEQN